MTGRAGRSRRAVLGGLAALAGLAGCTNRGSDGGPGGDGTSDGDPDPGGPFAAVRVEGTTLVVELAEDASVDGVNVIGPSGSVFAEQRVATGATRVEIALDTTYQPGEHRIVAVREGESVAETTLAIEPALEILGVGVGANNPDRMPDGMGNRTPSEAFVEIRNAGNGPELVEKLLFLDGVPNPTTDIANTDEEADVSGIFDTESGTGDVDNVTVESGETTLFTSSLPFLFSNSETVDCSSGTQTSEFQVTLVGALGGRVTERYRAEYAASDGNRACSTSISEVN
jgi:hypothetical protein